MRVSGRQDSVAYYAGSAPSTAAAPGRSPFEITSSRQSRAVPETGRPGVPSGVPNASGVRAAISRTSTFNITADDLDPIDLRRRSSVGGPQSGVSPCSSARSTSGARMPRAATPRPQRRDGPRRGEHFGDHPDLHRSRPHPYVRVKLADNRPSDVSHGARLLHVRPTATRRRTGPPGIGHLNAPGRKTCRDRSCIPRPNDRGHHRSRAVGGQ